MTATSQKTSTTTTIKLGQNLARNAATRILPSFAKSAAQRPKGFVYSPVAWPVDKKIGFLFMLSPFFGLFV